jgi:hypothetical protein
MKLEPPLSNLVARCQTLCAAECCGRDAYDFSPIQIASYLMMWRNAVSTTEVDTLKIQLTNLKANYGNQGASSRGITIEEMNQVFSATEIELLVREIEWNLSIAIKLITISGMEEFKAMADE